jgi:hypothetical protein
LSVVSFFCCVVFVSFESWEPCVLITFSSHRVVLPW